MENALPFILVSILFNMGCTLSPKIKTYEIEAPNGSEPFRLIRGFTASPENYIFNEGSIKSPISDLDKLTILIGNYVTGVSSENKDGSLAVAYEKQGPYSDASRVCYYLGVLFGPDGNINEYNYSNHTCLDSDELAFFDD